MTEAELWQSEAPHPQEEAVPLKAQIEAVLFLTGKPLALDELAKHIEATMDETEAALVELIQDYSCRGDSALEINDVEGYILQVRPDLQRIVNKMLPMELSAGAVRTLSVVAIKGPLLQKDLLEIRGSSAYEQLQELLKHGLISKKRKGRSYHVAVTPKFHAHFRLKGDKDELAPLVDMV